MHQALLQESKVKFVSSLTNRWCVYKEATTGLEYAGHLPQVAVQMQVKPFAFGMITETDEQGCITGFEMDGDVHVSLCTVYIMKPLQEHHPYDLSAV